MTFRMPYQQIAPEALPDRVSVLGFIKCGGVSDLRWSRKNEPYLLPTRYVEPARFRVTTRERDMRVVKNRDGKEFKVSYGYKTDEAYHAKIEKDQPSELNVRLMFDRPEHNFLSHFGAHDGRRWICQGNGLEAQDITRGKVDCPCPRLKQFEGTYQGTAPSDNVPCKPRGVLSVILPEAAVFGGFWQFKTTSYESIANIRTQLRLFHEQWGTLVGLPFTLKVYPATKQYDDGKGGTGTTTQPIVTLVLSADFDTARQIGATAAERSRQFLLAAGGIPSPERHQEIVARDMEEEAEEEGREFFSREQEERDAKALDELNARFRQSLEPKPQGRELPVLEVDEEPEFASSGPDYEEVPPEEPHTEASAHPPQPAPTPEPEVSDAPSEPQARHQEPQEPPVSEELQAKRAILSEQIRWAQLANVIDDQAKDQQGLTALDRARIVAERGDLETVQRSLDYLHEKLRAGKGQNDARPARQESLL